MKRVLVHGFGSIGQRHLRVIREQDPGLSLAVLSEHGTHRFAGDTDVQVFTNMPEAQSFQPDAVVVANAAVAHVASAKAWLQTGAHVLVEKPVSVDLDGVDELTQLAQTNRCTFQVGYNLRYAPGLRLLHSWCLQRRLGRIHSARLEVGQHLASWRKNIDPLRSVSAQRSLGGGVLLELSHEIDYLQWILGPVKWVSSHLLRQGSWQIDVEDTALLVLGLSGPDHCVASVQLDFVRHDATRTCTLIGEMGSLRWNGLTGHVEFYRQDADAWQTLEHVPPERDATYRIQWDGFALACRTGAVPEVTLRDGACVLRVVDAARRSASAGGARVDVESFA